jgi:hypothetical protein
MLPESFSLLDLMVAQVNYVWRSAIDQVKASCAAQQCWTCSSIMPNR